MSRDILPSFSALAHTIQVGAIYQHYKGLRYQVLSVARHSETLEELVVYQALYGDRDVWVRPLDLFMARVDIKGKSIPRFQLETNV